MPDFVDNLSAQHRRAILQAIRRLDPTVYHKSVYQVDFKDAHRVEECKELLPDQKGDGRIVRKEISPYE
jgi:hypothetical protein